MLRILIIGGAVFISSSAGAQSITSWTATSGIEQFALTDIVRGKPPVDASPVAWQGAGPMLSVARTRTSGPRVHRIEFVLADTNHFSYRSNLREFAGDPEDGAVHLEGRYEYRRDMLTRHLPAWLRTSIGVRGSGAWLSMTQHVPPANDISKSSMDGCGALVVGALLAAEKRLSLDVNYANGLRIGRVSPHGSGVDESHAAGGGWTTDLGLTGRVRLTPRYAIAVRFFDRGDGIESSHRSFTTSQRQFSVGVLYAK
jgi:hypothetical protein